MALFEGMLDGLGEKINELFKDTGEWCADVLDVGTKYYNKFIAFAYELVTKDIQDGAFKEFWEIVNFLNSVFVAIASTLLVGLFFYTLFESSMESRAEVSMWKTVLDYLKLLIANFLVVNSLNIVIAIFKFGTNIALYAVRSTTGNAVIINEASGLNNTDKMLFMEGVTGLKGLLIFIIALIGAVVMIASAIMIIMEIFKRFFKIFVFVPFASLSFCTVVLPDNKGGEIAKGYLKNAIATSIEAGIIVFCLVVSSTLVSNSSTSGGLMGEIFNIGSEKLSVKTVTINSAKEHEEFESYCVLVTTFDGKPTSDTPYYNELGCDFDSYRVEPNDIDSVYSAMEGSGSLMDRVNSAKEHFYPATAYVTKSLDIGTALLLVVKCILPMILTAAVIKETPAYASKALGM